MRTFALLTAIAMGLTMGLADAKQCRDKHGKFMKCPTTTMAPKHKPCHDPKTGKFVKCPV